MKSMMLAGIVAALTITGAAVNIGAAAAEKDIVDTAVAAGSFTTLAKALQAADLVKTLKGAGPFTVFAPTNAAFAKLPAGTVENLVQPENKATLDKILTYHVVPGRITAQQIASMAAKHHGTATLKTVEGDDLRFMKNGKGWVVVDAKGGKARITIANVMQSNGVSPVVDRVLMP